MKMMECVRYLQRAWYSIIPPENMLLKTHTAKSHHHGSPVLRVFALDQRRVESKWLLPLTTCASASLHTPFSVHLITFSSSPVLPVLLP